MPGTEGQEQDSKGDLYYDEHTIKKVRDALERAGVTGSFTKDACINEMENAGILFRERGKF